MSSVAYMDVAIGLIATIALLIATPVLAHHAGGWGHIRASLPATHFQILGDFSFLQAMELFLPTCLLLLGNQSMYQKFFSAKSEKAASRAVVGWFVGTIILETVIVALAVVGSVLFPNGEVHDRPREILAYTGPPRSHRKQTGAHAARRNPDGRYLRQGRLDREQLSLLARPPTWSTTSLSAIWPRMQAINAS